MSERDARRMRRALELARRGRGRVEPNPLVGAVVVRDGRVVGEGHHAEFGGAHAERRALEAAGEAADGATVYVNLEPCAHHGKTPPCADALVRAGVSRVVIGCEDPDPEADGGLETLREAGVAVEVGVERVAALRLNAPFVWRHRRDRPFVTLKLALSLDGRIAAGPGQRTEVTGDEAWEHVHGLRAVHDAVAVGRRTVEIDDPRLTARGDPAPRRPPVRVVLATRPRLPEGAGLAGPSAEPPVWVVAAAGEGADTTSPGPRVLEAAPAEEGPGVDPADALRRLGRQGVGTVLLEGGGRVAASFLRAGLVERMHLIYAPRVFGSRGVEGFPGAPPATGEWRTVERRPLGGDTLLVLESPGLTSLLAAEAGEAGTGGG